MKTLSITMLGLVLVSLAVYSKGERKAKDPAPGQVKTIGNLIKQSLENYHYRKIKVNDDVSKKAFEEFLKRVDYSKNFLLQSHIEKLRQEQSNMDDQITDGKHQLLDMTVKIMRHQIRKADALRAEIFKEQFQFNVNEYLELDPEKRSYPKNEKEFRELWRKIFKHATLNRYLAFVDEEKDKKTKKEKKMTDKEMRKKAHKAISEKYANSFKRMLQEDRYDELEKFFNAIATIYDPHTQYLPPKRKEDFDIDISGSLEGIGAVLQAEGSYIKVVRIVPGGAAWRQRELEIDDIILMVKEEGKEPVDLVDLRVDDAVRHIRGKKGTEVQLTVRKVNGTRKVIPIIRDVVQIEASFVKSSVLQHKKFRSRIGYIVVPKFYRDFDDGDRTCTKDVLTEIERLKRANVDGIILDLRNNGGGVLEDAKDMSGLFIKKGPIVQVKGHDSRIDVLVDENPNVAYSGPLIVMINRFSASASEILAAAMQDYGRAVVVGGQYSHGKGTVQAILNLNQGPWQRLFGKTMGALKVTIQKFYRVTGGSTQNKGVTPDIVLPDPMGYLENREQDLDYALPWDSISAQSYVKWSGFPYNITKLRRLSERRVRRSRRFKLIKEAVTYLSNRQDETRISLNKENVLRKEAQIKKMTKKFKFDEQDPNILISNYEASINSNTKVATKDKNKWKQDLKQRKKEWIENIRKDILLGEAIHIMEDIVRSQNLGNRKWKTERKMSGN